MRLVFTEKDRQVGEVHVEDGDLVGPPAWVRMVEAKMRRHGVTAEEALPRMDGWSNGYLTVTAVADAESRENAEEADTRPKAREWPGWQRDEAIADHYTTAIAGDVVSELGDVQQMAADWLAARRGADEAAPLPAALLAAAAAWLAARGIRIGRQILPRLRDAMTEGWLLGQRAATAVVTATDADWADWTPGDPDAARRVLADAGDDALLEDLLGDSEDLLIQHAADRELALARLLARAVAEGWSVDRLAEALTKFGGDRTWAYVTAQTELARAISEAAVDTYEDHGVEQHEWLVAGPDPSGQVMVCPICLENAAAGPVNVGAPFPSGHRHPPAHPRCRCAIGPWIDIPDDEP